MNFIQRIIYKLAERYLTNYDFDLIVRSRNDAYEKLQRELRERSSVEMNKFLIEKGESFSSVLEQQADLAYLISGPVHHKCYNNPPSKFKG